MAKATFTPPKTHINLDLIKSAGNLAVRQVADVPAPEFGEGCTVIVKGMTAANRHLLGELNRHRMSHFYTDSDDVSSPDLFYSGQCIMAALCAIDEEGNLVFGATPREAISTVSNLPAEYSDLVARIVNKAMDLTSGKAQNDGEAIANAEKN